jgi:pentapeptide MXKDX repeat protein
MLKRRLSAATVAAALLACTAIVPVFANSSSQNAAAVQQDKMKDDKMKHDKMAGNKMTSTKMSTKRHKHRRHRKHKMGGKMDKMQGNKNM